MLSKCSRKCKNLCNRLVSWVIRISNYKLPIPNYKESSSKYRDKEWLDSLCRHPAYKDLCLWVVGHRDQAVRRLLCSDGRDEYRELIGQVNAYEQMYNELIRELTRIQNSEE